MANLITVIRHLVENSLSDLQDRSKGKNRVNDMGDSLEAFITDIFADTLGESDKSIRVKKYSQVFSYLGNPKLPILKSVECGEFLILLISITI